MDHSTERLDPDGGAGRIAVVQLIDAHAAIAVVHWDEDGRGNFRWHEAACHLLHSFGLRGQLGRAIDTDHIIDHDHSLATRRRLATAARRDALHVARQIVEQRVGAEDEKALLHLLAAEEERRLGRALD